MKISVFLFLVLTIFSCIDEMASLDINKATGSKSRMKSGKSSPQKIFVKRIILWLLKFDLFVFKNS